MPPLAPPRQPDRFHRAADHLLPPLAAVAAVSLDLILWAPPDQQLPRTPALFGGWLVGLLLPRLYRHPYRILGLAPLATTAATLVALFAGSPDGWPTWLVALFALGVGLACGAVLRHRDQVRAEHRRFLLAAALAAGVGGAGVAAFVAAGPRDPTVRAAFHWLLIGLTIAATGLAWVTLLRPAIELSLEPLLGLLYRIRAAGPGQQEFPRSGPVLVIANHAAWLDPLILAKVLPRFTTPMMTASFYNIWPLRPVLRHIVHVIVVPEVAVRREGAPEIQEAIAALDAGLCVVVFPEGYLRRKEEQVLRRFGQGTWQILQARPATPVVACWIEGMWGSWTSHRGGPPVKGKRPDLFRRIGIGLSAPEIIPADVLADHLTARLYLMNRVLEARKHLGLPPVPPVEVGDRNGTNDSNGDLKGSAAEDADFNRG